MLFFQVGRRGRLLGVWHWENLPRRCKFAGDELFRENFMLEEFARILINFFMSFFLFTDSVLHVDMLGMIVRGKILINIDFSGGYLREKGIFTPDFMALFKKRSEIK